MDSENSFQKGERYVAFSKTTNEKKFLMEYILREFLQGNLSIKPFDKPKRVLDLGCGTGTNLGWMMELFYGHSVEGIDR